MFTNCVDSAHRLCIIKIYTEREHRKEDKMDAKEIGKKLKELRGERKLHEVAEALGISPSALSMYETGTRIPRDVIKIKIANYYGVNISDIFYA